MGNKNNTTCDICGQSYYFCNDCKNIKDFTPWRTITDTREHYKIYLTLSDYSNKKKSISETKEILERLDLSDLDSYRDDIKNVIKMIMDYLEPEKKNISKKKIVKNSEEIGKTP